MLLESILVFALSAGLVWIVRHFALKIGLLDIPNERSSHCDIIPRGAGIGFTLAVLIIFLLFHFQLFIQYLWSFLAIIIMLAIGVMDDRHDTSPYTKFLVIILATLFVIYNGIVINDLGIFFGWHIQLGLLAVPFTLLAVVGFTNALNLIDGLDGLAAGVSIVILSALFTVGYLHHDVLITYLSLFFIMALLGFLLFNWNPASIFMGDSGSLVLGFVIAILSIKALSYLPAVSILFLAAVPNMDVLIVLFRRKIRGSSVFSADKCHFHHILYHFFSESTRKTVLFLVILQSIYALTGLQIDKDIDGGFPLLLFLLNIVMLYMGLSVMIKSKKLEC